MAPTRDRVTGTLFATAALAAVVAVAMTFTTDGEGADIGGGMVILLSMLLGLVATVRTVQQQVGRARPPGAGFDRRELTWIAGGAVATAVLAAAVGQWPLAFVALVPAVVCAYYAYRQPVG
jgi:hypothetical protein